MEKATAKKPAIWDCGSSLYDSFELESLERQLDSVIASRTHSMPRLSDQPPPQRPPRKPSKISTSVHRLHRTVFWVGEAAAPAPHACKQMGRGHCGVRPLGGGAREAMTGAPSRKKDGAVGPAVRKTASEPSVVSINNGRKISLSTLI